MPRRSTSFGAQSDSYLGVTYPPEIPLNRVSADAARLAYTVAELRPLVALFPNCVVTVLDLSSSPARWVAGSSATDDGTTVIGNTDQGRWYVEAADGGVSTVNGVLISELSSMPGLVDGEIKQTTGCNQLDDGGGGPVAWVLGGHVLYEEDGVLTVFATGGAWRRIRYGNAINICWFGCRWDGTVDCGALINDFVDQWKQRYGINAALTLFVPDSQFRLHTATRNSTTTLTVPDTTGMYVGQKLCGTGIHALARVQSIVGTTVTMTHAASSSGTGLVRAKPYGYKLSEKIVPPDQMKLTIQGESAARINTSNWLSSFAAEDREGPVFVCDANVDGFGCYPATPAAPFWCLRNIAFVAAPGAVGTTATGVDTWYSNSDVVLENVQCYGFKRGFWLRAGVTQQHSKLRGFGCEWGAVVGGDGNDANPLKAVSDETIGLTNDIIVREFDIQYNKHGLTIVGATTFKVDQGICQNNWNGTEIGIYGGGHNVNNVVLNWRHNEGNGDDNPLYRATLPGGKHFTIYEDGTVQNVEFDRIPATGDSGERGRYIAGTMTSGSATVTGVSSTTGLYIGMRVTAQSFASALLLRVGTYITNIVGTTLTLSEPVLANPLLGGGPVALPFLCHGPATLHIPNSYSFTFPNPSIPAYLSVDEDATVVVDHVSPDGGFTNHIIHPLSRYYPPRTRRGYEPITGSIAGSTYTHDWAKQGEEVQLLVNVPLQINQPVNAREDSIVRFRLRTNSTSSHAITFNGIEVDTLITTGMALAGSKTSFAVQLQGGTWVQIERQPAYGWRQ